MNIKVIPAAILLPLIISSCHKYNVNNVPFVDVIDYKYKIENEISIPNSKNTNSYGVFDVSLFFTEIYENYYYDTHFDSNLEEMKHIKDLQIKGDSLENLEINYVSSRTTNLMCNEINNKKVIEPAFKSPMTLWKEGSDESYVEEQDRCLIQKQLYFSVKAKKEFNIGELVGNIKSISLKYFNRVHEFDADIKIYYDGSLENNNNYYLSQFIPDSINDIYPNFSFPSTSNEIQTAFIIGQTSSNNKFSNTDILVDFSFYDSKQMILNKFKSLTPTCSITKYSIYEYTNVTNMDTSGFKNPSSWKDKEPINSYNSVPDNGIVIAINNQLNYYLLVLTIKKEKNSNNPLLNLFSNVFIVDYSLVGGITKNGSYKLEFLLYGDRHSNDKANDYGDTFRKSLASYINENYPLNVYPYTNLWPSDIKDKDAEKAYEESYSKFFSDK